MIKHPYEMENANSGEAAGVGVAGGGEAKATAQRKRINCDADHIKNVVQEIRAVGLQLRSTDGDTQLATLPKVLQYLGNRGLNTYEGVALGYLRIATRIRDLKDDGWQIGCLREDVVGPDGLWHKGVARYYLLSQFKKSAAVAAEVEAG